MDALEPEARPNHTDPAIGASEPQDEAALRKWDGLAQDTVILVSAFASAPPMRLPQQVWAMLVVAVDIVEGTNPDRAGEVALFAAEWVPEQPPAEVYDGGLVVRLTHPGEPTYPLPRDHAVDVEMLLAYHGRWQRVGHWRGVDDHWPRLVAPTAALTMALHTAAAEAVIPHDATPVTTAPSMGPSYGGVSELLDAGLVSAGEELVWHRPSPRCPPHRPHPSRRHSSPRRRPGVRPPHRCRHRPGRPPPQRLEHVVAQLGRAHLEQAPERTSGAAQAVNPMRDRDAVKVTHDRSPLSTAYTPFRRVLRRRMSIERNSSGETVPLVWPMSGCCTGCANHVKVRLLPTPLTALGRTETGLGE